MAGTLPVTAQSPSEIEDLGARADAADHVQVLFAGDRAFDEGDVHVLGELLGVDERAADDVDALGEVDQALVEVEERHVAAGAAVEPDGGELQTVPLCLPPAHERR